MSKFHTLIKIIRWFKAPETLLEIRLFFEKVPLCSRVGFLVIITNADGIFNEVFFLGEQNALYRLASIFCAFKHVNINTGIKMGASRSPAGQDACPITATSTVRI